MNKAIFLGSFNPPHKGHYEVVKSIIDSGIMNDFNIEKIHVIPCYQNPNKAKFNTSFVARYKMCELMFEDLTISNKVVIDDIENEIRPKYTYNLIQYFNTHNDAMIQKGFWWIITVETIKELMEQRWKNSKELLQDNNFIIVGKDEEEWNNLLNWFWNYKSTIRAKFIKLNKVYDFHSTELREKIKNGESIENETNNKVDQYINNKVTSEEVVLNYKDFRIEIDEDTEIVRIMKGDKMVKFWYNQNDVQIAKLPKSSTIINEYTNIFTK